MTAKPYFTHLGFGIGTPVLWGVFVLLLALIPVSHVAAQTCVAPPSGLVSWWPGDGSASDIQDGNDGTLKNGATFAPGKVGQAFSFDGVDDFVGDIGTKSSFSFIQNTGVFTIDAWITLMTPMIV